MDVCGADSDGREFKSAREMWSEEIGEDDPAKKKDWYSKGVSYWEILATFVSQGIEASVDGVLGGYGHVNECDVKGSESFLGEILFNRSPGKRHLVALELVSYQGLSRYQSADIMAGRITTRDAMVAVEHHRNQVEAVIGGLDAPDGPIPGRNE
ncbi:Alpha N-terminal protein methyltransferase 1 [Nymphaea thermarum]|nr:Alpha N-terminal protein methyltransferase 1 [Nymphaea thermarum]